MTMDDNEALMTTSGELSDRQENLLIGLGICSATLSLIGSSIIVFNILRDWRSNGMRKPYDRMIVGLSSLNIIASIHYATNEFLSLASPAGCQVSGFLNQISIWAIWYNCVLSYYFLLTVVSQVRLKDFVRRRELWLHLSGLYFFVTAIIGSSLGWYGLSDVVGTCQVTDPMINWILVGIPVSFTFLSLIINNIVIYALVRKSLRSIERVAGPTARQARIKKEARTIMFLYVGFFFVTITPAFVVQVLGAYTSKDSLELYPLLIIQAVCYPLQGFFNVFIYIMPFYNRLRKANPGKPRRFILFQALFKTKVPELLFKTKVPKLSEPNAPELFASNVQAAPNYNANAEGDVRDINDELFSSSQFVGDEDSGVLSSNA